MLCKPVKYESLIWRNNRHWIWFVGFISGNKDYWHNICLPNQNNVSTSPSTKFTDEDVDQPPRCSTAGAHWENESKPEKKCHCTSLCDQIKYLKIVILSGVSLKYAEPSTAVRLILLSSCGWKRLSDFIFAFQIWSSHYVWWGVWLPHQIPGAGWFWRGKNQLPLSIHRRQV